jgi:hypothetical protein
MMIINGNIDDNVCVANINILMMANINVILIIDDIIIDDDDDDDW